MQEARTVAAELEARRESGYCPALPIAWTRLGRGGNVAGLKWLEMALAEREPYPGTLLVFPGYDVVRDQARFRRVAHELNLSI